MKAKISGFVRFGTPEGNRTPSLTLRRGALYPIELLAQIDDGVILAYNSPPVNNRNISLLSQQHPMLKLTHDAETSHGHYKPQDVLL